MAALPGPEWTDEATLLPSPPLAHVRHIFSHFALELAVVSGGEEPNGGWWQPLDRLGEAGLPTLYRRAAELVLARASERRAA